MTRGVITYLVFFLFAYGGFQKGVTAVIQTQQSVLAAVGEDVDVSCQLLETKEVHQVTWQKISQQEEKNIGSYSKHFNETVNPDFKDKVEFKALGLQNSSIVIRKVTEQDEGCYFCLFNSYPGGALRARTCLQVYELHEPVLHVRESPEESVVFCSATGRPAPTVTLTVTQQHLTFSQHNTSTVNNNNNTVTVTSTAVLAGCHDDSAQVGCTVSVLSAPQIQVFQRIQTSDDGDHLDSKWPFIPVIVLCGFVVFIIFILRRKRKAQIRESEINEPPDTELIERGEEPPGPSENSEVRKRTPPETNRQREQQQQPSSTSMRKLEFGSSEDFNKTK